MFLQTFTSEIALVKMADITHLYSRCSTQSVNMPAALWKLLVMLGAHRKLLVTSGVFRAAQHKSAAFRISMKKLGTSSALRMAHDRHPNVVI